MDQVILLTKGEIAYTILEAGVAWCCEVEYCDLAYLEHKLNGEEIEG